MKLRAFAALALCAALLAGCGRAAAPSSAATGSSAPSPDVSSSAPAATPAPTQEPETKTDWLVAPRTDLEITCSLAEYPTADNGVLKDHAYLSLFEQNGKTGAINFDGKIVIPAEEDVHWCSVCGLTNADESKIFNDLGEDVGPGGHGLPDMEIVYDSALGMAYVLEMEELVPLTNYGASVRPYVARVGTLQAAPADDYGAFLWNNPATGQTEGRAVEWGSGYVLVQPSTGKQVGPVCEAIDRYSDGLYAVQQNGLWGYLDIEGTQVIPCQYQQVRPFCSNLAAVQNTDGLWGYISLAGTVKVPFQYLGAASVSGGRAWVKTSEGWGVVAIQT